MFCPNCGNQVADGAKFCPKCGATIATPEQPQQPQQPPQPNYGAPQQPYNQAPMQSYPPQMVGNPQYQTMGGWLLFFVIVMLIGGVTSIVSGIEVFSLAGALSYMLGMIGEGWMTGILYVVSIGVIFCAIFVFYIVYLVFQRQSSFLRMYQLYSFIIIAMNAIIAIIYSQAGLNSAELWSNLVTAVVELLLMTLYYSRSVRVRTYMGSDEYMRQAFFSFGN